MNFDIELYKKEFKNKLDQIKEYRELEILSGTFYTFEDEFTREWFLCFENEQNMLDCIEFIKKNFNGIEPVIIDQNLNPKLKYQHLITNIDNILFLPDHSDFNFDVIDKLNFQFNGILKDTLDYSDCYFLPEKFLGFYEHSTFWDDVGLIPLYENRKEILIHNNVSWKQTWDTPLLSLIEMNVFCWKEVDKIIAKSKQN